MYWVRRDPLAAAAIVVIALLIAGSLVIPAVSPYSYGAQDLRQTFQAPGPAHWLGTDHLGRDLLVRVAYGARISFLISVLAVAAHTVIGIIVGMVSGFLGGWVDNGLMRVTDVFLVFPPLLFLILITGLLGSSLVNIIIALSAVGWAGMARQVRAEALALRGREFVTAARACGATDRWILGRHVFINILTLALVRASLDIGPVILSEATLSFLGIGVQPPTPSWGVMIAAGFTHLRTYPYLTAIPSAVLSLAILAVTFMGEGVAEALDPRWRRR